MKIALVLHLYQPPTQDEAVFRDIFTHCYQPLIKLIRNKKNISLTLNIPLSLLEQADRYGYSDWISDVKDLYSSDRIELTGTAAYHPLLTKISEDRAETQVVLNEYGLGYYFGSRNGFEGESAIMLKDIRGFFAPECAVNEKVIGMAEELGYEWILVDQTAVHNLSYEPNYYLRADAGIKIVPRNKDLSDAVSFSRGTSVDSLVQILSEGLGINVIALDAETFGHHNPDGMLMLEELISLVTGKGGSFVTVSQLIPELQFKKIEDVTESTWGASYEDMKKDSPYPYWVGNKIQEKLSGIEKHLGKYPGKSPVLAPHESSTQPLWFYQNISDVSEDIRNYLKILFLVSKYEHSDKYWWSSRKPILGNPELFHKGMIENSLKIAEEAAGFLESTGAGAADAKKIHTLVREVRSMLES